MSTTAVYDLGAFQSLRFEDPDGMQVELVLVVDDTLQGIHEPLPLTTVPAGRLDGVDA